jgi:hypothetical protein
MQGMGMSHEISYIAEAESVRHDEGNTNGADMRGTAALPGSKAISCMKGTRRNLGSPVGSFGLVAEGGLWQGTTGAADRAETGWRIGVYV